jgi:hypothetical protein
VNPELAAEKFSDDWKRYNEIKRTIHQLMKNADDIADRLRSAVITKGK